MLKRYKQGALRNGAAETRERMKEMVRTGCRRLRLSVGVCLVCAALQGGTAHAQDYGKPLDMPVLQSSSNFGKLRSTRFHSGVDFRTGGVEGKRVLAVEDGQIYRIGVKLTVTAMWSMWRIRTVISRSTAISVNLFRRWRRTCAVSVTGSNATTSTFFPRRVVSP